MKSKPLLFIILALFICHFQMRKSWKDEESQESIGESISLDKLSSDPVNLASRMLIPPNTYRTILEMMQPIKFKHPAPMIGKMVSTSFPAFMRGTLNLFALKAGTYTPTEGNGRFYAALKGPQADIVAAIIEGFQKFQHLTKRSAMGNHSKTDFQKWRAKLRQPP